MESVVVALADKLDTFASFFRIGERPTGSGDPFAIRRAVLGIIRIIVENGLRLPLTSVLAFATDPGPPFTFENPLQLVRPLIDFLADRLSVHLRAEGVRRDLILAVFALAEDDLVRLLKRVNALTTFLATDDGINLLVAFRRASNIVAIEEKKGGWEPGEVLDTRLEEDTERYLNLVLHQSLPIVKIGIEQEDFAGVMGTLAALRGPVDEFFEKVTVNDPDPALRENRLRLLSRIRAVMNQVADFSQIEG